MNTNKNIPKNQHYVPQFILRNFSMGKKKRVFVFDKKLEKSFCSSTRNIAAESKFYDLEFKGEKISLEPYMGEIECKASEIIRRIIKEQSLAFLNEDDKLTIAHFAALQKLRVKYIRENFISMNHILRHMLTERGLDCENVVPEINDEEAKIMSLSNIKLVEEFAEHFLNKAWILYRAPKKIPLYLSDNPITLHNNIDQPYRGNLGLACRGIEIFLPISKQLSISFLCPSLHEDFKCSLTIEHQSLARSIEKGEPYQLHPVNVSHQNSLQVAYSSRYIYSATGNFELVKLMIRKDPNFKQSPEMSFQ